MLHHRRHLLADLGQSHTNLQLVTEFATKDRADHNTDPLAITGTAEVVKSGYPDHFALQPDQKYFDEAASSENPIWYMVDIKLVRIFRTPVTRAMLAEHPVTSHMVVLQKGSRLSIQPVTAAEWLAVHEIAGIG